jgi:hypothetical protein
MGAGIITKYTYVVGAEQSPAPTPDAPENGADPVSLTYLNSAITISGQKIFVDNIYAANLTGTNTGDVTLSGFGSTPNASGLSLSGQVLRMQPADETNPGGLSITSQVFTGNKEFSNALEWRHASNAVATGANAILTLPTTSGVRVTNASLTSIAGVATNAKSQLFILVNMVGGNLTIVNNSGAAGTGEKIITGTGADLTLAHTACIILYKDITTNVWRVVGGSGGGGGAARAVASFTGTTVAPASTGDQTFLYTAGSSQTFTGFGTISGFTEGIRVRIMGSDDTNTLTINESDASNGWLQNGSIVLYKRSSIEYEYNATLARMVEVGRVN